MGRRHKLPGLSDENTTRRNVLIGGGYVFGGMVVIGAIAGDADDDEEPDAEPDDDDAVDEDDTTEPDDDGDAAAETDDEDDPPADTDDEEEADDEPDEPDEEPRSDDDELPSIRSFAGQDFFDGNQHEFSGDGQIVTDEFDLVPGLAVAIFEHDGESNFQVSLEGETEEPALVNVIGAHEGVAAFAADRGEHLMDINADGEWSVTIAQPFAAPEEIRTLPVTAEGEGQDVVGPIELEGGVTVSGQHEGESNFQVILYEEEEATGFEGQDVVFNEIGEFDGEARGDLEGIAWVDVNADGSWRLSLEE